MIVGIDASNIRAGGGVTHLLELLRSAEPSIHGVSQVVVWSGKATLSRLEDRPWLVKSHQSLLDKGLPFRTFWQRFRLSQAARVMGCDVLFIPGGSYVGDFAPIVTISQNLLPFEWQELRRFGWTLLTHKMVLLRFTQSRTFRRAAGTIFLTQYAHDVVMRIIKKTDGQTVVVPHGIDERFACAPREQLPVDHYTFDRPFRVLYVSIVDLYKHQWYVAEAIAQLRRSGLPVSLDLVGPATAPALKRLKSALKRLDLAEEFIHYLGPVPYTELNKFYAEADVFLLASSCEAFGQILTEAMSSGLPIACSNRSALPELLGDSGVYFDPERPTEIANAIKKLFDEPELRIRLASESFKKVQGYSWKRCSDETFSFVANVVRDFIDGKAKRR